MLCDHDRDGANAAPLGGARGRSVVGGHGHGPKAGADILLE